MLVSYIAVLALLACIILLATDNDDPPGGKLQPIRVRSTHYPRR